MYVILSFLFFIICIFIIDFMYNSVFLYFKFILFCINFFMFVLYVLLFIYYVYM